MDKMSSKAQSAWEKFCVMDRYAGKAKLLFLTLTMIAFLTGLSLAGNLQNVVIISIDAHQWSRENSIDLAEMFLKSPGRHFVFLHVSGLDQVGPQYGWLSPEYIEELAFIDDYLTQMIDSVQQQQNYLIMVTSDHAGHARVHGSQHPDDYRLPCIICSDTVPVKDFHNISFSVVDLKGILEKLLRDDSP